MERIKRLLIKLSSEGFKEESEAIEELLNYSRRKNKNDYKLSSEEDSEAAFFGIDLNKISNLPQVQGLDYNLDTENTDDKIIKSYLGSGMYRIVYGLDNDFILKIAHASEGSNMNKFEFNIQKSMPDMFPKVYAHGEGQFNNNFDWIIMDKVEVIVDQDEFDSFFPNLNKKLKSIDTIKYSLDDVETFLTVYSDYIENGEGHYKTDKFYGYPFELILKEAEKDYYFRKLAFLAKEHKIDLADIGTGNVGKDKHGNLLIIDGSYFE